MSETTINQLLQYSPLVAMILLALPTVMPLLRDLITKEQDARLKREERITETLDNIALQLTELGKVMVLLTERIGKIEDDHSRMRDDLSRLISQMELEREYGNDNRHFGGRGGSQNID